MFLEIKCTKCMLPKLRSACVFSGNSRGEISSLASCLDCTHLAHFPTLDAPMTIVASPSSSWLQLVFLLRRLQHPLVLSPPLSPARSAKENLVPCAVHKGCSSLSVPSRREDYSRLRIHTIDLNSPEYPEKKNPILKIPITSASSPLL